MLDERSSGCCIGQKAGTILPGQVIRETALVEIREFWHNTASLFMNTMQQNSLEPFLVPPPILKVESLIKIYGKRRVVDGVSFHVNKGEIVGLLGPNGAGKTTSFRMACGLIETNGGIVYLDGKDVTNWPMYRRSREGGMKYLPQENSVFRNLSVQNNLLGVMEMLGMPYRVRRQRCNELLEKFRLTHLRRSYGGKLSGGERRRLEIARALVSEPKIILLDEPFANIDPITVNSIQEIIRQLANEGIAILITDHQVRETLQITQRSYVIQSGRVLCHGTPTEVLNNPEARKVYFGEDVQISAPMASLYPPGPKETPHRERKHHNHREPHEKRSMPEPPPLVESRVPRPQVAPSHSTSRPFADRHPNVDSDSEPMRDYWEEGSTKPSLASGKRLVQKTSQELPPKPARPLVQSKQAPPPTQDDAPPTKSGMMRLLGWGK